MLAWSLSALLLLSPAGAAVTAPAAVSSEKTQLPWGQESHPKQTPPEPGEGSPVQAPAALPPDVQPIPFLMAVLGDSISAGLFAGSSLAGNQSGVTPDDIRRSYNGWNFFETKTSLSWASGEQIDSHYRRAKAFIERDPGHTLAVLNFASTGNTAADIVGQAQKVAAAMNSGKYLSLKYVTLLIGANDVCAKGAPGGTPNASMRASLLAAMSILAAIPQREPIRIFMSGMPDVPSVARPAIRDFTGIGGLTCAELWKKTGICKDMLNWSGEDEYRTRAAYVDSKNTLLSQAAAEAGQMHPNLQIVFSNRFAGQAFAPADMAFDCFHPNKQSQERIAAESWQDVPWFK